MSLPLMCPLLGTWPETQACALTGNQTIDPLVRGSTLNPLSHTSQGSILVYWFPCLSFHQYHTVLIIVALFFFRIVLAHVVTLLFHTNFRITLSISTNFFFWYFKVIALNYLHIHFGTIDIFLVLGLPVQTCCVSFLI